MFEVCEKDNSFVEKFETRPVAKDKHKIISVLDIFLVSLYDLC